MNNSLPIPATITMTRKLTDDTTLFTLKATGDTDATVANFLPGQFLELSVPGAGEMPVSYCGLPSSTGDIELCIRHVGHVSSALREKTPGGVVALRGPFGHGFPIEEYRHQNLLMIAGGLGMAPLRSLLLHLLQNRNQWNDLTLLYGAREPGSLLFLEELLQMEKNSHINIHLAVDRSGEGPPPPNSRIGQLPVLLESLNLRPDQTWAALCGPPAAYPGLVSGLKHLGLPDEQIHLSLERQMKCGLGRCGHCAVGTLLCCTNGPVFSYARLKGIEGALA